MEKLEPWHGSEECKEEEEFHRDNLTDVRLHRIEDRLSAVVDWIIEREKMGGASPKRKSNFLKLKGAHEIHHREKRV